MPVASPPNPALSTQLGELRKASVVALRAQWRELFGSKPPKAFGPDLLRRAIAQRVQERARGGLPKAATRLLEKLLAERVRGSQAATKSPRRIKAGAILQREWNGQIHSVTVNGDQFLYSGKAYASLSEIARLITGTRWSGPRFFGIEGGGLKAPPKDAIGQRRAVAEGTIGRVGSSASQSVVTSTPDRPNRSPLGRRSVRYPDSRPAQSPEVR
jgi:hypothetical protein